MFGTYAIRVLVLVALAFSSSHARAIECIDIGKYFIQAKPGTSEFLRENECIRTPSKLLALVMGDDGNLVLYRESDGRDLWSSKTSTTSPVLAMQEDGNLVIYSVQDDGETTAIADSRTSQPSPGYYYLGVGDDANVVIYSGTPDQPGAVVKALKGASGSKLTLYPAGVSKGEYRGEGNSWIAANRNLLGIYGTLYEASHKPVRELGNAFSDLEKTFRTGRCGGDICDSLEQAKKDAKRLLEELTYANCNIAFEYFTKPISAYCANHPSRLNAQGKINTAKKLLVDLGFFNEIDFQDVEIRWCALSGDTGGMVPDRNKVLLNTSYLNSSARAISPLLAHEMFHVLQYRRKGTSKFKCEYSEEFLKCGGCQDRGNSLEKEAYEFEEIVSQKVENLASASYMSSVKEKWVDHGELLEPSIGIAVANWKECSDKCENTAACEAWGYRFKPGSPSYKKCWLKKNIADGRKSVDMHSGYKF